LKIIGIIAILGLLIGAGVVYYIFNIPQREVQSAKTDFSLSFT